MGVRRDKIALLFLFHVDRSVGRNAKVTPTYLQRETVRLPSSQRVQRSVVGLGQVPTATSITVRRQTRFIVGCLPVLMHSLTHACTQDGHIPPCMQTHTKPHTLNLPESRGRSLLQLHTEQVDKNQTNKKQKTQCARVSGNSRRRARFRCCLVVVSAHSPKTRGGSSTE